jgi:transposase
MKGHFTNSNHQLAIVEFLERVKRGELTLKSAAHILGFSYRQVKRIYKRFKTEGQQALIHRACGKASNRAVDSQTRQLILDRYQQRYPDFGKSAGG